MLFSQLIKADSVLLYFEVNSSFSLHCYFQFARTYNCIAKVIILGHIVDQGRRKKKNPAYGRQQLSRPMRIVGPIQIGEVA